MSSEISNYVQRIKDIQTSILEFIDNLNSTEENFQTIITLFNDNKIKEDKKDIRAIVHLISKISNHHRRSPDFFKKIEQLLNFFKDEIKKYFSNKEIFHFFKSNKRILLFLFDEKILTPDEYIHKTITNDKYTNQFYPEYFFNEFKPFYSEQYITNILAKNSEIGSEIFEEKRRKGENDSEICQLIQNDSIEEFIILINKNLISIQNLMISSSIYETNPYLLKKSSTILEYAAFFGSMQIFKYLFLNNSKVTPTVWYYAVHGDNPEMINFLQENCASTSNCIGLIEEAIKCHHNDITNYIQNNFLQNNDMVFVNLFYLILKYYNFTYFPDINYNELVFYNLCKFDYVTLVNILIKTSSFNMNMVIILKLII